MELISCHAQTAFLLTALQTILLFRFDVMGGEYILFRESRLLYEVVYPNL